MLVMALAHDFTHEQKYLDGVGEGMSYLLGRNPMDQSYVTGYGERPLEHPHHRFWAHQANAAFPSPPPGAISGGPNSGLQDPYVQAAGLAGLRAGEVLRRQHRSLVGQRDRDQLERAAGVGRRISRREGCGPDQDRRARQAPKLGEPRA